MVTKPTDTEIHEQVAETLETIMPLVIDLLQNVSDLLRFVNGMREQHLEELRHIRAQPPANPNK